MISARLVHLIESNAEEILERAQAQFHRESTEEASLPLEHEIRGRSLNLMHNLGEWLSGGNEEELAQQFDELGRQCIAKRIPLHEAVRSLAMLRRKMLDYAEDNLISNSSIELYAEEELARRLGSFFDTLMIHLVQGFELAMPKPAALRVAGR